MCIRDRAWSSCPKWNRSSEHRLSRHIFCAVSTRPSASKKDVYKRQEYGQPIDNEYDLEEIYRLLEKENKKAVKLTDFQKNEENPFMKQAIEGIENHVVKKYKSCLLYTSRCV